MVRGLVSTDWVGRCEFNYDTTTEWLRVHYNIIALHQFTVCMYVVFNVFPLINHVNILFLTCKRNKEMLCAFYFDV